MANPQPNHVLWTEGDRPEPVTPMTPLVGLETDVLRVWLETSPILKKAYHLSTRNRQAIETLAREAVFRQWKAALDLRASGLAVHEAEEQTTPAMWTPPTWPTIRRSATPTPAAQPSAGSPSPNPES